MFGLAFASLALGAIFGASRVLGKDWAPKVYLTILGGTFVYLTLSDRRRKKLVSPHLSPDDSGVLERSQTLSQQIDGQLKLDDLKWTNLDPRSTIMTGPSNFPSDQGVFKDNVLYLPGELKGRLRGEELDPLVASSLILHSDTKIRRREILSTAGFIIVPFFLLIAVLALVGPLVEPGTIFAYISIAILVFSAFLILFGGGYLIARTQRSLVLESDKKAAKIVGKDSLLRTLKKLDELNLPDQERLKKRKNYLVANYRDSYRPSIDERIDNLQKH